MVELVNTSLANTPQEKSMAKQRIEYEATDIDMKGNEAHAALSGAVLIAALVLVRPAAEGADESLRLRVATAHALSMLENSGFALLKREDPPPVFASLFDR